MRLTLYIRWQLFYRSDLFIFWLTVALGIITPVLIITCCCYANEIDQFFYQILKKILA